MSHFGPARYRMTAKISPSVDPRSHFASVRSGGCVSFGAIGPLPFASAPWQKRQFFAKSALPAAIDSALDATGFFNFAASGFPCAAARAARATTNEGMRTNDTRRISMGLLIRPDFHTPARPSAIAFPYEDILRPLQNRWLPVVGGLLMNLALGSLYAWSVFVPPLEREFGWTRAQTSWVYTIAIVCFAVTFVLAGRIQDVK